MGFRPGHIRSAWCGIDTGASGGGAVPWQHSFYPSTLRSDAILTDRAYANIISANLAQAAAPSKYYVCQGFFHPDYDGGAVVARVSFTAINPTAVSTITFNGAYRVWNEFDSVNVTISPGAVQTIDILVSAIETIYTVDIGLQPYGNNIPDNFFESRVNWTAKQTATQINVIALTLQYNLTKKYC